MSSKQGQLSRSDLLCLIVKQESQSTGPELVAYLADTLGMERQEARTHQLTGYLVENHWPDEQVTVEDVSRTTPPENLRLNSPSPTAKLKTHYWRLLKQTSREDDSDSEGKAQVIKQPVWQSRPEKRPPFPALMSEEAIQQRLLPALRQKKATSRIDINKLIDEVSRSGFVTELPMQHQSCDTQALQIIDDRQVHLMPYWLDHTWLTWHVRDAMEEYRFSHAVIEQGEIEPQSIQQKTLEDYQAPPEGSTILLLSDLGVLIDRLHNYTNWLDQILIQGYNLVVVTPCHINDYPADLAAKINLVSWEQDCRELPLRNEVDSRPQTTDVKAHSDQGGIQEKILQCPRRQWGEQLLMLCSAAIRLEPELLRTQRYVLNEHRRSLGKQPLPASAESLAWQHRAVTQKHSVAAMVDPEENKHWQSVLKQQPIKLKQDVFERQRQWRGGNNGLPDEIWFEEFAAIDRCCQEPEKDRLLWFSQDFENAKDFLNYLHQRVLSDPQAGITKVSQVKAWLHRVDSRLTDEASSEGVLHKDWQACLLSISDKKGRTPAGHVLDRALLGKTQTKQPRKTAWLCQLGRQLAITKHDPFNIPKNHSSLLARLDYRVCSLKVGNLSTVIELPESLSDELVPLLDTENIGVQTTRLQTDLTELELDAFSCPRWAKQVGRDVYGLFADLEIHHSKPAEKSPNTELIQRFRWIAAGDFLMGSPEDESERSGWEDQHKVTLTQGYWLADTAVTQEQWQFMMGDNPAKFENKVLNPVEKVSWKDAQNFIKKLNKAHSEVLDGLLIRLPSEAEWEHACRAGTFTPFSFGENVTSEQVNFRGSAPYSRGIKSEFRSKTVAIKSLPPNAWGLYEMHGNVYEWCADVWGERLGTEPIVDPYHSSSSIGANRVVRGGSWINLGRHVRSAYRYHNSPNNCRNRIGLRLSLGHQLKYK